MVRSRQPERRGVKQKRQQVDRRNDPPEIYKQVRRYNQKSSDTERDPPHRPNYLTGSTETRLCNAPEAPVADGCPVDKAERERVLRRHRLTQ